MYVVKKWSNAVLSNQALTGVVAMGLLGLVRGWQFFDHAGHLGGVLFAG